MGSRKIIMLVGSILIGALAGFALLNYVQTVEEEAKSDAIPVQVWVATENIAAGTSAADVQSGGKLELRETESTLRPATAIGDPSQIQGRVAVAPIAANQVIVAGMFDDPEVVETTFSDLIKEDQVAVTINVDAKRAVAGFVKPGDFVDIIVLGDAPPVLGDADAFDNANSQQTPYQRPARYLYRGVRIIALNDKIVGQELEENAGLEEETGGLAITLAIPPDAAQRILSVPESNLVLSLLPENWTPEAQSNEGLLADIQNDAQLPGEDASLVTPYGRIGFQDSFTGAVQAESQG